MIAAGAREDGQAAVEAALTMPVVLVSLLLIVQVGVVVRDAMAVLQAAREGARVAAVTADDAAAVTAAKDAAGPLDRSKLVVSVEPTAGERVRGVPVTVHVSYAERFRIPIVSRLFSFELPLSSAATMRLEQTGGPSPSPTPAA